MKRINKRVFLDYASTTPVDRLVYKAMKPFWTRNFGNASALYEEGMNNSKIIEESRGQVARITGVRPGEIIFTGSGTESNNLALMGILNGLEFDDNFLFDNWREKLKNKKIDFITSTIEHPAIIEPLIFLDYQKKINLQKIAVLGNGKINLDEFKSKLNKDTLLVTFILANNEIGVIQSIRKIKSIIKKFKNELGRRFDEPPFFHTDASQAPLYLDINIDRLGVDMMTLDGSKINGPKGIGCLIKKSYVPLGNIIFGGGQEFGLRPGTENVPLIVGFSKALELANQNRGRRADVLRKLQEYFLEQIDLKLKPKNSEIKINGSQKERLPNNINICIPGLNSEFAVIQLDEKGIACSAMTACKNISENSTSYVVDALGYDCGQSSLRFTLNEKTTRKEINFAINALFDII